MKSHIATVGVAFTIVVGLGVNGLLAQQAPVKRNFDAEIQAALESAKTAAGTEFLGTLVRTCLLPQSGGENTTDNVPGYVTNPASAPARNNWYADPAKVFDNLYFVGGKIHSAWALTTREGIILIDTIYPYNSEELIIGGSGRLASIRRTSSTLSSPTPMVITSGAPRCCRLGTGPVSLWVGQIGIWSRNIQIATRLWRRNATSSPPTV
jgi:hypothetical protein